jgi:hypothetical protein
MAALTTLDGLENGTMLAIQQRKGGLQRWCLADGAVTRVTRGGTLADALTPQDSVPVELLSGYLTEGLVFRCDNPPVVGEWFFDPRRDRTALVIGAEGETFRCAVFRLGSFTRMLDLLLDDLLTWRPCEQPTLTNDALLNIMITMDTEAKEAARLRQESQQVQMVMHDVSSAVSYLTRARERMGRG